MEPSCTKNEPAPRDLIVFGEDWGAHPSSTQHLIRHLAPGRRVVWVNSIGLRRPKLSPADLGRAFAKLRRSVAGGGAAPAAAREPAAFPLVQPLAIPMAEGTLGRAINRVLIGRTVRAAAAAAGLRRPVVWASLPSAVQALGALGESAVVYYCCDDFGALAGVDHAPALRMEAELALRADLILASSPLLAERFEPAKTHLLPHGVDFARFATPVPRAADMPAGGPVAGFYGTLAPWLDLGLVAAVARRLPQWRFVLIGHPATDLSPLDGLANVALPGARPHAALPAYAQHWTAGIIPFVDNAQIRASNPLKLREYLAAGRPVVSTPFPALLPYRALVAEATSVEGFAAALEATLADPPGAAAARRDAVAEESWAARAADAAKLIDALP
ncbi:MAG: glycosyltransferase [Paracraurococcus sp.]